MKVTKKDVMDRHRNIICVPYCALQDLLRFTTRTAHTEGVYGWNADVYCFDRDCIVMGYRPFGNIHPEYITIVRYEAMAKRVLDSDLSFETKMGELSCLTRAFIAEVTG